MTLSSQTPHPPQFQKLIWSTRSHKLPFLDSKWRIFAERWKFAPLILKHFNHQTHLALGLSCRLCSTMFLVSTSIRNEWRSCWSSKQQFPSLKRKPECSVCHWCHRQQTTLQAGNKAAGVFTPKHRGPYLFKPHTPRVPPCVYRHCMLMVPTSDSLSGLSHIWLPSIAISNSIYLTSPPMGLAN